MVLPGLELIERVDKFEANVSVLPLKASANDGGTTALTTTVLLEMMALEYEKLVWSMTAGADVELVMEPGAVSVPPVVGKVRLELKLKQ
jgi:hypothetical protein